MSKALLERMIIEETKNLSLEALKEILDFIQFIKTKKFKSFTEKYYEHGVNNNLTELNQMSLIHLEEEFTNYKETYPHEY